MAFGIEVYTTSGEAVPLLSAQLVFTQAVTVAGNSSVVLNLPISIDISQNYFFRDANSVCDLEYSDGGASVTVINRDSQSTSLRVMMLRI